MLRYVVLAFCVLLASPVRAESAGLVAVLPLADLSGHTLTPDDRAVLLESIRTHAGDALSPFGYTVLNGENTLQILTDNGIDPNTVCDTSCALKAAREMKAQFFLSGSIGKVEGTYVVILRMSESTTGRLVASVQLEAPSVLALMNDFDRKASNFFDRALSESQAGEVQVDKISRPSQPTPERHHAARELDATVDVTARGAGGEDLDGAQIYIDEQIVDTAPRSLEISAGTHVVKVEKDLYQPKSITVTLKKGDLEKLNFILQPNFGFVSVTSDPSEASVTIDGLSVGTTPLKAFHLKSGSHTVVVEHADYLPVTQTVVIRPGQEFDVPAELVADFGPVSVDSVPQDCEVSLDGEVVGRTPLQLPKVKTGEHRLEIRGEPLAYEPWSKRINVKRAVGAPPIEARLARREANVIVSSQPPGANVQLNGKPMGQTSLKLRLLGGDYQLRVSRPGYAPVVRALHVVPPDPIRVDLRLSKGGTGPGGHFTLADLDLSYRQPPPRPTLLPEQREVHVRDDNIGNNIYFGLIWGSVAGAGAAYATYAGMNASAGQNSDGTTQTPSVTVPLIVGVGVMAVVMTTYVLIKHYHAPVITATQPDPDAVAENQERLQQWEQEKRETDSYNAGVDAKVQQANAVMDN